MTTFLDEAAITGSAKVGDSSVPPTTQFMDEGQITGVAPAKPTFLDNLQGFLSESGPELAAGAKGAAELVLAGPGMLVGAAVGGLRSAEELLKGKPRREALQSGAESAGRVGQALNPVTVATKLLGYEPSKTLIDSAMEHVGKAIHGYGERIESQYRLPDGTPMLMAEDVDAFANMLMGVAGTKPVAAGINAGVKAATTPAKPVAEVTLEPAPEAPPVQVGFPPPRSGPAAVEITTPKQVKEIFSAAKKRGMAEANEVSQIFARAKQPRPAPTTPEEAIAQSKTRMTEGRVLGEEPSPLETGLAKMREGQNFDLTAAEKISLDAVKKAKGQLIVPKDELGVADPELLAKLGAGVALGAYLTTTENPAESTLMALGLGLAAKGGMKGVLEADLLRTISEGGPKAQAAATELYRQNERQATKTLQAKFGNQNVDIEAAVQEGMFAAMKAVADGTFRGESKFSTYLHQAVVNRALNQLRDAKTQPEMLSLTEDPTTGRSALAETLGHEETPANLAQQRDLGVQLTAALEKIDPKFKDAFLAVEADGMSYEAAAEHFGVPIGTIRSRVARAKEGLQQRLRDYREGSGVTETPQDASTPAARERGAVDPKLATGLAAVAGGAAIGGLVDPENRLRNAVYGALAGGALSTGAGRAALKAAIKSPDAALGNISTRLGNIAPELRSTLRAHELRVLQGIDRVNDAVLPFIQTLDKLPETAKTAASRALLNGDLATLQRIPGLAATYPAVQKVLTSIEGQLKDLGRFGEGVSNYFPRIVKDFEGLKAALGQEVRSGLEQRLLEAEAKMIRKQGRSLTDVEESLIVNRYLYAPDQTSFQPGFAKARKLQDIPEALQQFYEPPTESLLRYISGAVNDLETARFFGRDLASKTKGKGKKTFTDVDSSIGNLTARLLREGRITQAQAMEVRDILKARFEGGERGMGSALATWRNWTNVGLLGNVASAATQVGDSLLTIYHHGLVPTLQAVTEKIVGKAQVTPKQLGLINHVAEELSEMGMSGRALHLAMKYSGFHAVDMFAKGLGLNAALIKNQRLVATPAGEAAFRAKYQAAFGEDTSGVIADLKAKRTTPNTELLAFSELSDAQPVSKAELPEMYLRHPNGRLLYQLKTYMLKQADVVRRDAYQEIAKGTQEGIMRGTKNLAALATVYALANVPGDAIKDFISGRPVDVLSTPRLVENVFQTFGINRYAGQQLGQGKVVETALGLATPPVRVLQDVAKLNEKSVGYIPLVGRPVADRYFGGNERREIYEKRLSGKGQTLSPAAKAYLRAKRLAAKAKKLEEAAK